MNWWGELSTGTACFAPLLAALKVSRMAYFFCHLACAVRHSPSVDLEFWTSPIWASDHQKWFLFLDVLSQAIERELSSPLRCPRHTVGVTASLEDDFNYHKIERSRKRQTFSYPLIALWQILEPMEFEPPLSIRKVLGSSLSHPFGHSRRKITFFWSPQCSSQHSSGEMRYWGQSRGMCGFAILANVNVWYAERRCFRVARRSFMVDRLNSIFSFWPKFVS